MPSLPAVLDQRASEPLREQFLAALASGAIEVDASTVERVATVGVQLLLSAGRTAEEAGAPFRIVAPSPALADTLATLGLTEHFSPWIRR